MRKKALLILTVLSLLLAAGTWYLLCTEGGLHRVFGAAEFFVPGELSTEYLRGRLIGPVEVAGLKYSSPTTEVSCDTARLDWEPLHLFRLKAYITRFEAEGVRIETKGGEADEEPAAGVPEVLLPIGVVVDHFMVRDIVITTVDGAPDFPINQVSLGAEFHRHSLNIRTLTVDSPQFSVTLGGTITTRGSYPLDLSLTWITRLQGFEPVRGKGKLAGTLEKLEVVQQVTSPARVNLTGTVSSVLTAPGWEGVLTIFELTLADAGEGLPPVSLSGEITSKGNLSRFDIGGSFDASEPDYGELSGNFLVEQREGVWTVGKVFLEIPGKEGTLEIEGVYSPSGDGETVSMDAVWHNLSWPPGVEEPIAVSPEGTISLEGSFDDYAFTLETRFVSEPLKEVKVTSAGRGGREGATVKRLKVQTIGGTINGEGKFTWLPGISWDGTLEGTAINPGRYSPEWEGELSFSLRTGGEIDEGTRKISLDVGRIEGELRGYPIEGFARMDVEDSRLRVPGVELRAGSASLTASGERTDTWNMKWEFEAEDLAELIPGGKGEIAGEGTLSGDQQIPRLTSRIRGKGLSAGDYRIEEVELQLLLDMKDIDESRLDFSAGGIFVPGGDLASISIRGGKAPEGHTVSISATGENVSLETTIKGKFAEDSWEGTIESADLSLPMVGNWKLKKRESIFLSRDEVKTGRLCWVHERASSCLEATWSSMGGLDASSSFESIPLSLILLPLIPETVSVEGTLGGTIEFTYSPEKILNSRMKFTTSPGSLTYMKEGSEGITIPLEKGKIEGTVEENILDAEVAINMSEKDFIHGTARVPLITPSHPEGGKHPITGNLQFRVREPGLIPAFTPHVQNSRGVLDGNITITGTLENPNFTGKSGIVDGSADILDLGIRIEDARFFATSDGSGTLGINGRAKSGAGTIRLDGKVEFLPENTLRANFRVQGERFEAANTGEVWLLISPDIGMELDGTAITVEGRLEIPEGTIEPVDLADAVPVSQDVVILDEEGKREDEKKWKITSRMNLVLGEKVRFDGFGLSGRLRGSIIAEDRPESVTKGTGEIEVLDGKFEAYKQQLEIERGKLIFAGGPISDPGLDVRAVRKTRDVVVGVDVSGTVKSPRLRLFSSPRMGQADTLSYLLFGRPTRSSSSDEAKQLGNAAGSGQLIGGEILAREIGSRFGIEDITVEEGDAREEAALFIGAYLSPRLYVSYGIGLFQPINIYRIRYEISSKWFIQAEDGLETGADLFYKLEK